MVSLLPIQGFPALVAQATDREVLLRAAAAGDLEAASRLFYLDLQAKRYDEALAYGQLYLNAHPDNDAFALDYAYAALSAGDLDRARRVVAGHDGFLRTHPANDAIYADLFYAYSKANKPSDAIVFGERYLSTHPDNDGFAMDLAYAMLGSGNTEDARRTIATRDPYFQGHPQAASIWLDIANKYGNDKQYVKAIGDVDRYLTFRPDDATARRQRTYYVDDLYGGPRFQAFGYGQYEGRFADEFFGFDARYTLTPGNLQPYLGMHIVDDVRSGAPGTAQIFSDNAVVTDAGLRLRIGHYLAAFIEGGVGIGTRGQGSISDLRKGFVFSDRWNGSGKAYTDLNASLIGYSRYAGNTISYLNLLHDFGGRKSLHPIAGLNTAFDKQRLFGNNYAEAIAGLQIVMPATSLRLVEAFGHYFNRGLGGVPSKPYSTIRFTVAFGITK
ncbi:MAG: tetratricopeptide repeat protein [Candidatus Eremiobacteraeota bacterium]|nr:tetratricopeptide repeat protein [Candidatus Eremiobacteraeota bacterium]